MIIVFVGPPGSGKGTQCSMVTAELGSIHISTGDMLRNAVNLGDEIGKQAKEVMDSGNLMPDGIMINIISQRILTLYS